MGRAHEPGAQGIIIAICRALGVPVVLHLHAEMKGFYDTLPAPMCRLTRWVSWRTA